MQPSARPSRQSDIELSPNPHSDQPSQTYRHCYIISKERRENETAVRGQTFVSLLVIELYVM